MNYFSKLNAIHNTLDSVIDCTCDGDGCNKDCALKTAIQLPTVDVEDCDGNMTPVEALPVAVQGVVTVKQCTLPPKVDVEYVCNTDTNTLDEVVHVQPYNADGTLGVRTTTVTNLNIGCDEPKPDYEPVQECRGGTTYIVTYKYEEDDSQTEISSINTGIACNVTSNVDVLTSCDGTTKSVLIDWDKPTQVVFDDEQVLKVAIDTDCPKTEWVAEIEICDGTNTLVRKTTIDSTGTEVVSFYGDNWGVVPTPTVYTIGACVVELPSVDIEFIQGCSDIDGRRLIQKVVTDTITLIDTITLLESDLTTVVADGSVLVNCSGADYELLSQVCYEDSGNKYLVHTFINPTDETDNYKVWTDSQGDIVPEVTAATVCSSDCEAKMHFERCYDTGTGVITASGYLTTSSIGIESYTSATVLASTDPAINVGDDVLANIGTYTQVSCEPIEVPVDSDIIIDCAGTTQTEQVNQVVSIKGAENAIPVRIIEDCEAEILTDYEYVCNETTGLLDLHVFKTTDGVENTTPTITATTIACNTPTDTFDEETYCNATTGTTWIRTVSFDSAGVKTVLSDVDTTIACKSSITNVTLTEQNGSNTSIPAGFKSVTINNITGITTINGGYELWDGRRDNSISFGGDIGNSTNEILPAYTLVGGTWQWVGHL